MDAPQDPLDRLYRPRGILTWDTPDDTRRALMRTMDSWREELLRQTGRPPADLVARIRQEGFDPDYLQHVAEFNLRHPDSYHTLTETEHNRLPGGSG